MKIVYEGLTLVAVALCGGDGLALRFVTMTTLGSMSLLEQAMLNPTEDLRLLQQLYDHKWLTEAEYNTIKATITEKCFGSLSNVKSILDASTTDVDNESYNTEANATAGFHNEHALLSMPMAVSIASKKKGPRGPQRCSVCHEYRKDHICKGVPCLSVLQCGLERLHRVDDGNVGRPTDSTAPMAKRQKLSRDRSWGAPPTSMASSSPRTPKQPNSTGLNLIPLPSHPLQMLTPPSTTSSPVPMGEGDYESEYESEYASDSDEERDQMSTEELERRSRQLQSIQAALHV